LAVCVLTRVSASLASTGQVAQKAALDKKSQEIDATVGALAKKLLSKPKIYAVHKTMPAVYIRAEGDSVVLAGEGFPAKAKVTLDVGKKVVTPTKIEVSDDKGKHSRGKRCCPRGLAVLPSCAHLHDQQHVLCC